MKLMSVTLMLVVLMGLNCGPEEVTLTVQYANITDIQVSFQATDAMGNVVEGSQLSLQAGTSAQPTVANTMTITGVPPFTFSAPIQFSADSFCVVPNIIGDTSFPQFVWRVEATDDGIECVNDQGRVGRAISE